MPASTDAARTRSFPPVDFAPADGVPAKAMPASAMPFHPPTSRPCRRRAHPASDNARMTRTLADWLDIIERIHPRTIDMGLERIGEVARRLGLGRPGKAVITVGGTNGKGSTVAF